MSFVSCFIRPHQRLASLAADLDLKDALVVYYKNNVFDWQWSETVSMDPNFAQVLLHECIKASPNPARIPRQAENDVIVASRIENPYSDTTTVFLQLVAEKVGLRKLGEEEIRDLNDFIFQNDNEFKLSLQGCFGAFKSKIKDLSLSDAVQLFNKTYLRDSTRWGQAAWERLTSETGQQYIRLRLKTWIRN